MQQVAGGEKGAGATGGDGGEDLGGSRRAWRAGCGDGGGPQEEGGKSRQRGLKVNSSF